MKLIPLTQGFSAMVDDEDYEELSQYSWSVTSLSWSCPNVRYARRYEGKKAIAMHRQIAGTPAGQQTDHINRNGLDNQRINLRIVTASQNQLNRGIPKSNTSGEVGVVWHHRNRKWQAQVILGRKMHYLGQFVNKSDAIAMRRKFNDSMA